MGSAWKQMGIQLPVQKFLRSNISLLIKRSEKQLRSTWTFLPICDGTYAHKKCCRLLNFFNFGIEKGEETKKNLHVREL